MLCVTPWFPAYQEDPAGSYIVDSLRALRNLGHEIDVLVTQPWRPRFLRRVSRRTDWTDEFPVHWSHYFSIPRHYFRFVSNCFYKLKVVSLMKRLHKRSPYQVIHAHTEICGLAAVKMAQQSHLPVIVTVHGIDTCARMWKGFAGRMIDHALLRATRVVFVGDPLARFFSARLPIVDNFRVVSNGFRMPFANMVKPDEEPWLGQLRLISVSNLVEGKGVDLNIQMLAKLHKKGVRNWHYTIVGGGADRKKLEALVVGLGLTKYIEFVGACDHDRVYAYLRKAHIFVLPSYREAFGIVYAEAMAMGLLTIAVKGEGAEAMIRHGETGLLVEPKNVDDLANVLSMALMAPDEMKLIAVRGREYIYNHFTWRHHAEKLAEVYQEARGECDGS